MLKGTVQLTMSEREAEMIRFALEHYRDEMYSVLTSEQMDYIRNVESTLSWHTPRIEYDRYGELQYKQYVDASKPSLDAYTDRLKKMPTPTMEEDDA